MDYTLKKKKLQKLFFLKSVEVSFQCNHDTLQPFLRLFFLQEKPRSPFKDVGVLFFLAVSGYTEKIHLELHWNIKTRLFEVGLVFQ